MIWKLFGVFAAVLTMFGFVPQVIKMSRTKSVHDVSVISLVQFLVGVSCWMVYGIHLNDPIIIVANAVTWLTLVAALTLHQVYSRREKEARRVERETDTPDIGK